MDVTKGIEYLYSQGLLGVLLVLVISGFVWYYIRTEKDKREMLNEIKELNKLIFEQINLRVQDSQTVIKENTSSMRDSSQALYVISEKIETNKAIARSQ